MTDGSIIVADYNSVPVVTAFIGNNLEFISFAMENDLSNIYLGRVDHIVKNINAAFVKFGEDKIGYLPLNKISGVCVTNRDFADGDKLKNGDEVIVQIDAEAIKTKKVKLTTGVSFSGKYTVLTLGRTGVGASMKLDDTFRKKIIGVIKPEYNKLYDKYAEKLKDNSVGIIIRTEAGSLNEHDEIELTKLILEDIDKNLAKLVKIIETGRSRTVYSLLYNPNTRDDQSEHDSEDILDISINKAKAFLKNRNITDAPVIQDNGIHGIPSKIQELTHNKVWLKSGAYLIIEQLESFNAIDVNTGKAIKGKADISEKVNMEAADEIMRQIRLRNLTGMILIDFINMKQQEQYERLIAHINSLCRMDSAHTSFIDITGLGIMELTRNKNDKSLKEILHFLNNSVDI
jgi:ribonuclease G